MRSSRDHIPLAPVQEHFWTAGEFAATDAALECAALQVHGDLDRNALGHAVLTLLARHEVLRCTVADDGHGPGMRVLEPPSTPPLEWLDLSGPSGPFGLSARPDADRDHALHEALTTFAETGVDLAHGPLLRFLAVRLAPDDHVLALAVHHLIADATAVRIMVSELSRDYLAALSGLPSPVPEPELQYGDFAEWERSVLLPAVEEDDAPYWRETLHDAQTRLDLRIDRPRPHLKGSRGRRVEYRFSAATRTALLAFAEDRRTTPYTAACAAFAALAGRSAGVPEVVLGVLTANRPVAQVEHLVGQFANTLPLRIDLTGDPDFGELTGRCARVIADAIDHGRLPLSRIVALTERDSGAGRTPLFQHLFLPRTDAIGDIAFAEHPTSPVEVRRERGRFDTIVEMEVSASFARVWVEYDTALYTEPGMAALLDDFAAVLAAWTAEPGTPLSALPLGTAPAGREPHADLATALGLRPDDTVLVDGAFALGDTLRPVAERSGVNFGADAAKATVAAVPADLFATYAAEPNVRLLVVEDAVSATDLARLGPGRRAVRLVPLPGGGPIAVDLTGAPSRWPVLLGGRALCDFTVGLPGGSPYTPGPLLVDGLPSGLTARWNPEGDVEIVAGLGVLQDAPSPHATTGDLGETDGFDDPLLALVLLLWKEVLGRPGLTADSDFFVSGGHSMVAARLIADLHDLLGVQIRMRTLFENPTPALLTAELRRGHPHLDGLLTLVASDDALVAPVGDARPAVAAPADGDDAADGSQAGAGVAANGASLLRADAETVQIPLLASQRQLWLAQQADPGALTHTIPLLLHLDGPVDEDALRAAVAAVVARQDGLRGVFAEAGGEPVQRILPFRGFDVPVLDLSGLPGPERDARAAQVRHETAHGGFDLTTGPLLRALLVRLSADRRVLHLLFHHLVTDEVSMTLFMREMSEFYRAHVEKRPPRLPALDVGFADIARAEQRMLAGPEGDRLRRFWLKELAGAPQTAVPTDHPRPQRPAHRGEFLERRAPGELGDALRACAREHRTTAFSLFCTVVIALLHRLTGQDDIVIGVPTENRAGHGADRLIGCFLNVVPVRVVCAGDPTFDELLRLTSDALLRSYEHQRLPFAEIVHTVRPERTPGVHPIYQVTCELQLDTWMPVDLPGCTVNYELVSHGTARYDLSFHTLMRADDLSVMLEIDLDLWDRATGLARIDETIALLERVTSSPRLPISQLL